MKSMVPQAGSAELFVVGAELDGKPALFIVESGTEGVIVEATRAWACAPPRSAA